MASKKKATGTKKKAGRKSKPTRRAGKKQATPMKMKVRSATRKPAKAARSRATRPAARSAPRPNPLRALAQRIVDVTVSVDDDAILDLYADTVESTEMGMPPSVGLNGLREKLAMWNGMVRDPSWKARNVWVDGNTIIVEWTGNVTFNASGKRAEIREIAIHDVADGKIVRERFYYDPSFMQAAQPDSAAATMAEPRV